MWLEDGLWTCMTLLRILPNDKSPRHSLCGDLRLVGRETTGGSDLDAAQVIWGA